MIKGIDLLKLVELKEILEDDGKVKVGMPLKELPKRNVPVVEIQKGCSRMVNVAIASWRWDSEAAEDVTPNMKICIDKALKGAFDVLLIDVVSLEHLQNGSNCELMFHMTVFSEVYSSVPVLTSYGTQLEHRAWIGKELSCMVDSPTAVEEIIDLEDFAAKFNLNVEDAIESSGRIAKMIIVYLQFNSLQKESDPFEVFNERHPVQATQLKKSKFPDKFRSDRRIANLRNLTFRDLGFDMFLMPSNEISESFASFVSDFELIDLLELQKVLKGTETRQGIFCCFGDGRLPSGVFQSIQSRIEELASDGKENTVQALIRSGFMRLALMVELVEVRPNSKPFVKLMFGNTSDHDEALEIATKNYFPDAAITEGSYRDKNGELLIHGDFSILIHSEEQALTLTLMEAKRGKIFTHLLDNYC